MGDSDAYLPSYHFQSFLSGLLSRHYQKTNQGSRDQVGCKIPLGEAALAADLITASPKLVEMRQNSSFGSAGTAVRPAVIKSAASAASPEGFPSSDQVGR